MKRAPFHLTVRGRRCRVYLTKNVPVGKMRVMRYGAWGHPTVKVNPLTDIASLVTGDTVRWG